jgi:hypothetical protein
MSSKKNQKKLLKYVKKLDDTKQSTGPGKADSGKPQHGELLLFWRSLRFSKPK